MISIIRPLPVGNALRVFLEPPTGARICRVLRKAADNFAGPDDTSALRVYEGEGKSFVDYESLPNDQMAFYRPFYRIGRSNDWVEGATASATPRAFLADHSVDAVQLVRDRLEAGLAVECERGTFQTELGYVQVLTAPPTLDTIRLPAVTVQLDNASPGERGIGEDIFGEERDEEGGWADSEGWLEHVSVSIVAWSLNPNERIELRKALRRILLGNLSVFDTEGLQQVSVSFSDFDAVSGEFGAPIYQCLGQFHCIAPARVTGAVGTIEDIEVSVHD